MAITFLVPLRWPAYDGWSQTISELSAVGAPTRPLWVALATLYTLLSLWFAWGLLRVAPEQGPLRRIGWLLLLYGAFGLLWPFAPMHLRESIAAGGATISDTVHITLGILTVLLMIVAIALGTRLWTPAFRRYSGATLLVVVLAGALTGVEAPGISLNAPTPSIGLWERVSLGAFLLWSSLLGLRALREPR